MIVQSAQAEHQVLKKLAAYFKVPYKMLQRRYLKHPDSEEDMPVFKLPVLEDLMSCKILYYCVENKGKINLLDLLNHEKMAATEVMEAYELGMEYVEPGQRNRYLCFMYIKGYCWVVRRMPKYSGYGALCLHGDHVLEPFRNFFLLHFHPE